MVEDIGERRRRKLRVESAAANVIRGWLTGEALSEPPPARRRKYRKNLAKRPHPDSGQVTATEERERPAA